MVESLANGPEVTETFAHFLTINIDESIVHPETNYRLAARGTLGLEYFCFMMGESEGMPTSMDVELLSEVLD